MKKSFVLLISIFFAQVLFSQDMGPSPVSQKDFQLWLDAGLGYKVNKKLDLKFEASYRRENNLADLNENYIELQVQTDPLKFLVLSGGYRLSGWYQQEIVNRLFGYARFDFEADRFRFQYRIRYDYNFNSESSNLPANLRNKVKVKYRTRKFPLDPYMAFELFFRTNPDDRRFSQQRFDLGLDYSIAKKQDLSIYFRFQKQLNAVAPAKNYILGLSYSIDI
jgi:hypothetical protein